MVALSLSDACSDISGVVNLLLQKYPRLKYEEAPSKRYIKKRYLGSGTFGEVHRVASVEDPGKKFALKEIKRPSQAKTVANCGEWKSILTEIDVLSNVNHPNLIKLHDLLSHEGSFYLVIDYVPGQSLLKFASVSSVSERDASEIANHLLRALHHFHSMGVAHSDLKPENVLISRNPEYFEGSQPNKDTESGVSTKVHCCRTCKQECPGPHPCCSACGRHNKPSPLSTSQTMDKYCVTLVDYGSVKVVRSESEIGGGQEVFQGSTMYVALEVIDLILPSETTQRGSGLELRKSDIFSLGIVIFMLLCRNHPFGGTPVDSLHDMKEKQSRGISYPEGMTELISSDAKSFLINTLNVRPSLRPSAWEALQHNWILNRLTQNTTCISTPCVLGASNKEMYSAPENPVWTSSWPSSESLTSLGMSQTS